MDGILIDTSATAAAETWLDDFDAALASGEAARIAALFAAECHLRDIIAFTWGLRTTSGADAIATRMDGARVEVAPRAFALAAGRTPPRRVSRAGIDTVEAIFGFATSVGSCTGVVRLVSEGGEMRAWTLLTILDEIRGHEDPANGKRWRDVDWKRNFGGENWLDRRQRTLAYDDRDPAALVIGAADLAWRRTPSSWIARRASGTVGAAAITR